MDESEARSRLGKMVASASEPTLDSEELGILVADARRADKYRLWPTDTGWIGTYDLNAAAAEGWRWKAAKCANAYAFTTDGQTFSREQMHEHCLAMADHYAARVRGSVPTLRPDPYSDVYTDVVGNL